MAKRKTVETPADSALKLLMRGERKAFSMTDGNDRTMQKVIKALTDKILKYARSHLPKQEMQQTLSLLQPKRVAATAIPLATAQALTVWTDPVHTIAVNIGLMTFMYEVARVLAPHLITRGPDDPPAPPESEAVSRIATLIDWMSSPVRAPVHEVWPTGEREIRTAENMAQAGEYFVVSHEVSHIILQHLIVDTSKVDPSKLTPHDLDNRPYEQEIEADVFGAVMSIDSINEVEQQLDSRSAVVGIMLFFQSLMLAEEVGAIISDSTHPSASDRLWALWQVLPRRYGSDFAKLTSWANQLNDLMNRIAPAALQERSERRLKAAAYMDRIFLEYPDPSFREYLAMDDPKRRLVLDAALLDETFELIETAPSAVLESIDKNLMEEHEYRLDLFSDRGRRHSIALFFVRYMPARFRRVLGVEWSDSW